MRLFLILLLSVVIPVKAMAALALPLVGMPQHDGQKLMHAVSHAQDRAASAGEHGLPPCHHADPGMTGSAHDAKNDAAHECPHLAMPALTAPCWLPEAATDPLAPAQSAMHALVSIALGVPQPPPTRLH